MGGLLGGASAAGQANFRTIAAAVAANTSAAATPHGPRVALRSPESPACRSFALLMAADAFIECPFAPLLSR